MSKHVDAPDPSRVSDREHLDAADFDAKISDAYVITNEKGERKYHSDDKADAEQRLKEMAATASSIGEPGAAAPKYVLSHVQVIETEDFDKDGHESRTRGKRSGKEEV